MKLREREKRFLSQIARIRELTREEERASRERFSAESEAPSKGENSAPQGAGGPPARQGARAPATPPPKRGAGGGSPPRLDTQGKRSVTPGKNGTTSGLLGQSADTRKERKRLAVKPPSPARKSRTRLARPKRLSESAFREAFASELDALGRYTLAGRVRECGQVAWKRGCQNCGEPYAEVTVTGSCQARCCPHCARIAATKRRERLLPALLHVPEYFYARREELHKQAQERWQKAYNAQAFHREKIREAQKRYAETLDQKALDAIERHSKHEARAEEERKRYGKQAARLDPNGTDKRKVEGWNWRLITLSPRWNPRNSEELTIGRLKQRWSDVTKRWAALHKELGPAVSAVVSVELSVGGFVHLHALVFCPEFLEKSWLQEQVGANCYVDIRALKTRRFDKLDPLAAFRKALKEAVKYAVKSTSPLSYAWLAGEKRRTIHPELAARWTVATHKRQLGRVYGEILRDSIACEKALNPKPCKEPEKEAHCWQCGHVLTGEKEFCSVATAAKELGPFWARAVRWRPFVPLVPLDRARAGPYRPDLKKTHPPLATLSDSA